MGQAPFGHQEVLFVRRLSVGHRFFPFCVGPGSEVLIYVGERELTLPPALLNATAVYRHLFGLLHGPRCV